MRVDLLAHEKAEIKTRQLKTSYSLLFVSPTICVHIPFGSYRDVITTQVIYSVIVIRLPMLLLLPVVLVVVLPNS